MKTIKSKLLFVSAILIISLTILTSSYALKSYANYKELMLSSCQSEVNYVSEITNKIIMMLQENARELAIMGELLYVSSGQDIENGRFLIKRNFESEGLAIGGGIWFEPYVINDQKKRCCFYAYNVDGKVVFDETFEDESYNYLQQKWYIQIKKQILNGKKVVWTSPYFDEGGTKSLMTTVGCGIFDKNGKFIGMSTVDRPLEKTAKSLAKIKPTENSFILYADLEHDFIMADTDPNEKVRVGESLKEISWFEEAMKNGQIFLNDELYFSFNKILDNNMIFLLNVPKYELFAKIYHRFVSSAIVFSIIMIILLVVISFLLNKFINRPITILSRQADEIGKGNFGQIINVQTDDELGQLAKTFNKMSLNIKDYTANLKIITAEKERIGAELDVARHIQASMLPCIFPPFPDRLEFDIFASMLPAKEVGGDFYDFFLVDDNHLALVMADVSGKGVPAALFMVIAKTLIKNHAQLGKNPAEIFTNVNNQLCENNDAGLFVTAWLGILEINTGKFTYANAGHNPPLFKSSNAEEFKFLKGKVGLVLAGMPNIKYNQQEIILTPKDMLFLYTDGVTEATNLQNNLYSESRLKQFIDKNQHLSLENLLKEIKADIDFFVNGAEQFDDITMLAIKIGENKMKRLVIDAMIDNLPTVLNFVETELVENDCSMKQITQILIAVEEIFVNVAHYSYNPEIGKVTISIGISPDNVTISFEDKGTPYNPIEKTDPDITKSAEERDIGGLGIFMVKKIMDYVEYKNVTGKNILTISKKLHH